MDDLQFLKMAATAISTASTELAADNIKALVKEQRTQPVLGGRVTYTLTGPEDLVKVRVEQIFAEYSPVGYGTRATIFPDRTVVVRAGSCD